MSNGDLGSVAPLLVALLAVLFIAILRPVSSDILRLPGNLVAAVIVTAGGVMSALRQ